jgi:hypothetical protein
LHTGAWTIPRALGRRMDSRDKKELLKFKELEHVKIEKAEQLFKDMLESMDFEKLRTFPI